MTDDKKLLIHDISRELDTGTATTKFLLKRFDRWLKPDTSSGPPQYSRHVIPMLLDIKQWLADGMLPSEIEDKLAETGPSSGQDLADQFVTDSNRDIRVSQDGLVLIRSLFNDISDHQKRIAIAHEKRAAAEERKAVAIEKRAEAEEKKATAMNNIAAALQEMNRTRGHDPDTLAVAHEAANVIQTDEALPPPENGTDDLSDFLDLVEPEDTDLPELLDDDILDNGDLADTDLGISDPETSDPDGASLEPPDLDLSDIEDLISAAGKPGDEALVDPDDLNDLTEAPDTDDLDDLLDADIPSQDLDDLGDLIDSVSADSLPEANLDDLSQLIGNGAPEPPAGPDDLSALIDAADTDTAEKDPAPEPGLDDLSLLLDHVESGEDALPVDDLSLLLDEGDAAEAPAATDDLSLLLDNEDSGEDAAPIDDLSLLLDEGDAGKTDAPLDDLSLLVDSGNAGKPDAPMDNLSLLVQKEGAGKQDTPLDDLSLLVDSGNAGKTDAPMDNLSLLFNEEDTGKPAEPMDDLSALIDGSPRDDMDDLSALVQPDADGALAPAAEKPAADPVPDIRPSLKPAISRKDNLEKYKAAVMKIIIGLKQEGVSAEDATQRLNEDGVQTISGKPNWTSKALAQIYAFIDKAS